jgi:transmembrane sensor
VNAIREFFEGHDSPMTADIEVMAARWVIRHREGLDPSAAQELAVWRTRDPRHEAAFQRLSAMADALQRARQTGAADAIAAELNVRANRRRIRRRVLTGAGLAALMFLSIGWWTRFEGRQFVSTRLPTVTAAGSIQRLPDGSLVELNGDSEIAVQFEPGFRRVELVRGEALFSVAKNPNRPFIVRANGLEVRAVGTAFNVRLEKAGVEVMVTEGKVRLDDALRGESLLPGNADGQPGTLVAGQKAVVETSRHETAHVTQIAAGELAERLAWRKVRLEFSGIELAEAVERINQTNRVQVSLAGEAIGKLRLTGTFLADDPETFCRLVAETFNLDVENPGGDRIVLKQPERAEQGR